MEAKAPTLANLATDAISNPFGSPWSAPKAVPMAAPRPPKALPKPPSAALRPPGLAKPSLSSHATPPERQSGLHCSPKAHLESPPWLQKQSLRHQSGQCGLKAQKNNGPKRVRAINTISNSPSKGGRSGSRSAPLQAPKSSESSFSLPDGRPRAGRGRSKRQTLGGG